MTQPREKCYYLTSGLLLLLGGVIFLWGGKNHPAINAQLGPLGSEEFFRHFVAHVLGTPNWQAIHTGILAGPVLWVLGAVALWDRLRRAEESQWSSLALVALALGGLTWAVAFVFDGFVAPYYPGSYPRPRIPPGHGSCFPVLRLIRSWSSAWDS
ncbi:MAG TPA: hypothetical protein VH437_03355 [Terriglobales bacterium]|jgi:hypothetical protein